MLMYFHTYTHTHSFTYKHTHLYADKHTRMQLRTLGQIYNRKDNIKLTFTYIQIHIYNKALAVEQYHVS